MTIIFEDTDAHAVTVCRGSSEYIGDVPPSVDDDPVTKVVFQGDRLDNSVTPRPYELVLFTSRVNNPLDTAFEPGSYKITIEKL